MVLTCQPVEADATPAVMCLDGRGGLLFSTRRARRICERWNRRIARALGSDSVGGLRLPERVACLVSEVGADALDAGLRLVHSAVPEIAVTVNAGRPLPGTWQAAYYLLTFDERVQADTGRGPLGRLTPSERRVALLVAEGLRNEQIAEQLGRSRRTVEYQLNSIYRKLDLSSRTQLLLALA